MAQAMKLAGRRSGADLLIGLLCNHELGGFSDRAALALPVEDTPYVCQNLASPDPQWSLEVGAAGFTIRAVGSERVAGRRLKELREMLTRLLPRAIGGSCE